MPTSRKWILLINILLIAVISIYAANIPNASSEGPIVAFVLTLLQAAINLALALIYLVIYLVQRFKEASTELSLSLMITFFLSAILVGILSFPACLGLASLSL
ncbi:membrane protein [Beggiatoa sp. PS]|nr:membrane protein [Beggiatoa sp. PS]